MAELTIWIGVGFCTIGAIIVAIIALAFIYSAWDTFWNGH